MEVRFSPRPQAVVAEICSPHLDAGNVSQLRAAMEPHLAEPRLVVDLGHLEFLDSSGLGTLLWVMRRLGEQGGSLKLCGATPTVQALFDLVRMGKLFSVYKTCQEALEAFQS